MNVEKKKEKKKKSCKRNDGLIMKCIYNLALGLFQSGTKELRAET